MPVGSREQFSTRRRSRVVRQYNNLSGGPDNMILRLATVADEFPRWGAGNPFTRDAALRNFLPTEPILETAYYSTIARYAALSWHVEGPERMARMSWDFLHNAHFGQGWLSYALRLTQDLYSTDNGAFIEIAKERENDPPGGINHLDSSRCMRTDNDDEPVIYRDLAGQDHRLKWFQVVPLAEFPSPMESARGAQVCAISRVLRAAQVMRDINTYKHQKISGRNVPSIWLVGGVTANAVKTAMAKHFEEQEAKGNNVYTEGAIIPGYSPDAAVSAVEIKLASLPDGFDEEVAMRMYLIIVANAFGLDYQDLAPMPGGNLGSGHQSQILDRKSKEKGPRLYMQLIARAHNANGILPRTVTYGYGEQDVVQDTEMAKLALVRAQERKIRVADTMEMTPEIAAQRALDAGDLTPEEFAAMGYTDLTGGVILQSSKDIALYALGAKATGRKEWSFWDKMWGEDAIWQPYQEIVMVDHTGRLVRK